MMMKTYRAINGEVRCERRFMSMNSSWVRVRRQIGAKTLRRLFRDGSQMRESAGSGEHNTCWEKSIAWHERAYSAVRDYTVHDSTFRYGPAETGSRA